MKLILSSYVCHVKRMALAGFLLGALAMLTSANAMGCTLYASPSGSSKNAGTSPSSPTTLAATTNRTQPGSTVCLLAGTYYVATPFPITRSGTASSWVVYTNYNGGAAVIVPGSGSGALMWLGPGVHYIEIKGLQFEGKNTANTAISCSGCDHLRAIGNKISHMGASGIITYPNPSTGRRADYITIDHNQIYHSGYNQGFGSAISFRENGWYDTFAGFHSFVTNNIISGMYDNSYHHTDGNGIISDNAAGDVTPAILIANNVVYENGRRCIFNRYATNAWVVNNTCYKNDLYNVAGEFQTYYASGTVEVNNLSFAWNANYPYLDGAPLVETKYHYNRWIASGTGTPEVTPSSVLTDSAELMKQNPLFINPPFVSATGSGQYNNAVPPDQITDQFHLQSGSPAIGAGIDPTTITGISTEIISGLKQYVYTDIEGNPRTPGSHFDLGAYVHSSSAPPNPPTGLTAVVR